MTKQLIFPMAFYALYMWSLGLYLFMTRLRAIRSGEVSIKYFRAQMGEAPTERTVTLGRHYDNQFQVPILFLMTCLTHLVLGQADSLTLVLAWIFVASRLLHSWIHLGSNRVQYRAAAFVLGWMMIALLWIQIIWFALR